LYFVDHGDPELLEAVRRGRAEEFSYAGLESQAADPGSEQTFRRCLLDHERRKVGSHALLYELYRQLLQLRSRLAPTRPDQTTSYEARQVLLVQRERRAWMAFCFSPEAQKLRLPVAPGRWRLLMSSASSRWGGPASAVLESIDAQDELELAAHSFVVFARADEGSDDAR
jgi:maltooligosyltrehalose trehalohydrolase